MANSWFVYTGGATNDPLSYAQVSGTPSCPNPNQELCAIFANTQIINTHPRPVITAPLNTEINVAIDKLTESQNVVLRPLQ